MFEDLITKALSEYGLLVGLLIFAVVALWRKNEKLGEELDEKDAKLENKADQLAAIIKEQTEANERATAAMNAAIGRLDAGRAAT